MFVENFEILKVNTSIIDVEFILPFAIDLELKNAEGEIGQIQSTIPITLINFIDPLSLSVDECREKYRREGLSKLEETFFNQEMETRIGILYIIKTTSNQPLSRLQLTSEIH